MCTVYGKNSTVKPPIVVVPTSFNGATEEELASHGINIVIYANQLIRAAFPAMQETARGFGFRECGTITVVNGTTRIAYDWLAEDVRD